MVLKVIRQSSLLLYPPPSGNQIISIQIFGIDIQNAFGLSARFEYDVTQVIYEGFDAGDVLPNPAVFPEEGPGFVVINITSWSGGFATVNSGLMGTLYFRTTDTFGGTKIQLVHAEVGRNNQFESPRSTANFDLEISKTPSPDVDENGMVDVGDFLLFVEHFGASRGHEAFSNRFDLNGNGKIDFSDFSILTNNFGKAVPVAVGTLASVTLGNDPLTVDISGNFSDANGDVLHYSAVSSANTIAMASVVGSEVTVSPVNVGSATITVIATNAGGLSATQDIAVTVQSAMGFAASRTRRAVDENTPPGEKVGDPVAMMSFGSRTYRLSGTDAELFVIDSSSGQIRTREGVTYNYEGKKTYWVRVVMMDQQYRDLDNIIVTITLNDVDEPPSSPPSNFLVIPDNESLTVHFSAVSDEQDRPPVRGYQAEIRRGENGPWGTRKTIYGRTNTSVYYHHIDPEGYHSRILFNGKLYQVRVRTYNSEGASDWSALVSGTPVYVPSKKRSELAQFQDEGDIEQTVVSLSDITGEGGKIIVPRASLPATISQEEVEGVFSEIVEVDVSDAPDVPAHIGFTITPSSSLFDIKLKARFNNRNVDIGDALMEPVEICLPVPAGISMPVIFFYHGDEWKIPENQRVDRKNICAQVDRFSLFGVGEEAEAITRLILELDRIDNTDDTAPGPATIVVKITPGMPFDMTVGLSVTGGTLSPSAIVTIAKGSTQSGAITVTQTGIGQATVSLGAAPALPANYRGLPITMGNPLVLFDIAVPAEICDRTTQVQTAILSEIKGVSDCGLTTSTHLSSVTTLSLNKSGITTLQADDFSGLSSLETIRLKDNSLSTLPAGLFSGLSSLRRLDLRGNPGSPFTLTLQLDRIDNTDDTASGPATIVVKVSEGAPFDMTVGLSVTGGTLSPSGNVTIAKGSTQSSDITVTQSGMGQATVSLDAAPAVPEGYRGIQTAVGNPLVLFTSSRISFGSAKIADQTYKLNSAITNLVLPTATGGTAPITYALSPETNSTPDLPTGLSFDANTHTISGTPSAAFPTTTFTWTATDADNNTAELMFDITVPTGICDRTTQVRDEILDQINGVNDCGLVTIAHLASITTLSLSNSGIAALQADDFSGLSSLETIRLKDNSLSTLPAGLFSGLSSLRRLDLRGNPGSPFTLTLQLDRIDNTDDTASGPATIVVKVSEGAPFDMTVGLSVTGGTLSPSGNVTIAKGSTQSSDITVTQSGMGQATVSLDAAPAVPEGYRGIQTAVGNPLVLFTSSRISFGSAKIADQTYKLNSAITNLVLPTATGGTAPITYALSPETNSTPDLPTGLSFDANTHTISGIPSAVFPTTTFTWTATDADNDTAKLMFDITVPTGICARTTQVRDEILDQIDGVSDCGLVTITHLSSVETLSLNNSGITSLKSDDFSGLSSLATLRLKDNSLSTLPAGVFSGLTSLTRLDLRGNPGSPFTLTLQLDRTDDADDTASGPATVVVKVSEGAPFDMTVSLSVTGGTLSPSANVTIAKGSTQSGDITVTQSGMGQATVSLDAAPALPTGDNVSYRGIQAAVGNALVLFEAPNGAPVKVGTIGGQTLTEGGTAVTVDVSSNFSDPENDPLTYSATSDDTNIATVSVQNSVVTISPVGAGSATITVTALDATGSNMSVDQTIAVTVNPAGLSFGSATIADQTYKLNSAITNLVLPTATGGTVPITYALSPETNDTPNLPAGLSFDANTRTISGTPSAIFSTTTFTWTATDADNDTAELMFDITVPTGICARTTQVRDEILDQIDGVSDCGLVTIAHLSSITTLSLNHSDPDPKITTLQSADFSGLSSLETLRLRNNSLSTLPAGVFSGLTSLTRVDLRGNPGSAFTLTLQLDRTDDADDTASGPATIVVKVAEGAPFDMTVGLSVTGGTLSSSSVTIAKGGTQSGDITVTGTGQVTVSLDAAPAVPNDYSAIQTAVGNALVLFEAPNGAPVKVGTIGGQTLTEGGTAVTVDVSSNFSDPENDPLTYSATSDDTNIATVSVQGSMVTISPVGAGSATVTVTALDATGSNMSVDQTIAVTVNPAGLSFGSATIADQTYKLNSAITNLVLPTATGGTAPITYALSPETNDTPNLPTGLSFNANTRTISGMPSAVFPTTTFTWTATDADNDTADLMFDITVPTGICARTTQVRDEILDQIDGVSDCGLVTIAHLSSITTLSLNHSDPDPKITTLQSADFSGLSSLETLRLRNNSLSTLPAGVFSGLTSLTRLDLRGNPGSDFTLTLQLDRTDDADDTASGPATIVVKVAEGAPFDMTVSLSVSGGTLSPSNSVTIAKGSTQSSDITVTQSGMGQATVSLDAAPALPIGDNVSYRGIQTAVGNPLVLFEAPNGAPEKVGTIAAQTLTEGTTAVTVDVSSNFSDPENDPLTYSAASDDENVATVSVQGSMVTISPVGAGSATVTVTALDATGSNMSVDQTIAVTVNPLGICSRTTQVRDEILDQIDGVSDCGLVTIAHLSSITTL
ncbi:MAG: leucine-rich repeat protein, partial [Gemmatimonadetes bacterium]|nr:leucine-rich repeat protein [Gemmatimonadota bacterium]